MKYILYKDFYYFFKKYFRYFCIYLFFIILYVCLQKLMGYPSNIDLFYYSLGLNCSLDSGIIEILLYLFNICTFLLFSISLFKDDITKFMDNVFLRQNVVKWFLYKVISISLLIFLLKLITYFFMFILFNHSITSVILEAFFCDYLYVMLSQLFVLIIYILYVKFGVIVFVFLGLYLFFMSSIPINILNINLSIVLLLLFVLVVILLLFFKYIGRIIFEKIEEKKYENRN